MRIQLLLLACLVAGLVTVVNANEPLQPDPDLHPEEVVRIVVDALRDNSVEQGNDGIATAFRFASPANKAMTGPLSRFTQMLEQGYSEMLNHVASDFGPGDIDGAVATQVVMLQDIEGREHVYLFVLGKQQEGPLTGTWMTDAVHLLATKRAEGIRI